jgi:hypothetical protein
MSWMSKKTGRPKEKGGHKRINISVDKFTEKALTKIREGDGNISRFIEKQLKPVLENLDPGEASIHVWRIETYLSRQIVKATQQNKPDTVIALASIATALKDFRNLCGVPPRNFMLDQDTGVLIQPFRRRRESMVLTFVSSAIASIFSFLTLHGLGKEALPIVSNQTGLEGLAMKFMVQISPYLALAPIVILAFIAILLKVKPSIADKPEYSE